MTGYENLMRSTPNAADVFLGERSAWQAYRSYVIRMCRRNVPNSNRFQVVVFYGDETSRVLFGKYREARRRRDAIGNPRHKRNSRRFQPRSNGNARTA